MPVYRYIWSNIDLQSLQQQVPGTPTTGSTGPVMLVDINAPDTSKDDLDEYMASRGYSIYDRDPLPTPNEQFVNDMGLVLTTDPRLGMSSGYVSTAAEGSTTTTSSTMQTKATLVLGNVSGVYRVNFYCELAIAASNARLQCRLYNLTDASDLCFSESRDSAAGMYRGHTGFAFVTMSGVSKTFRLQFASQNNSSTVTCRRARIDAWRVS